MSMDDAQHLDDTIAMLQDIRDVYREFEEAREAFYSSGKDPDLEPRWTAAKIALDEKRTFWVSIREYAAAVNKSAAPDTVVKTPKVGAPTAAAQEG